MVEQGRSGRLVSDQNPYRRSVQFCHADAESRRERRQTSSLLKLQGLDQPKREELTRRDMSFGRE
jgi:hypothetical protein